MNITTDIRIPEKQFEAIFALDLDPIKFKLMDKKEGHGWTRAEADHYELQYRRYLALLAKYPDEIIVPDTNVDKFWHGHILDTMKYAEDCQAIFGYFLHHYPYFGMRDAEDASNLAQAAASTRALYDKEFGVTTDESASYCVRASANEEADAAYCVRAEGHDTPAYCVRAAQPASEAAYCVRAATPASDPAYCVRVAHASPEAAYCVRAAQPARQAAYCVRASQPTTDAAYCVRAGNALPVAAYCVKAQPADIVTGKGRPTLKRAASATA